MATNQTARRAALIALSMVVCALCAPLAATAKEETKILYGFESSTEGWTAPEKGVTVSLSRMGRRSGKRSLSAVLSFPGTRTIMAVVPKEKADWLKYDRLVADIYVPDAAPADLQVMAWLKDWDMYYYQNLRREPLEHGKWTTVAFDIRAESLDWQYEGHFKPWDGYVCRRIQDLGFKFISKSNKKCTVLVDNVHLLRADHKPEPNAIYNLRVNTVQPYQYEKFEISFNLRRVYENPFDPAQVDVKARFITPSGRIVSVPGFFYQGFMRRLDKRREQLIPMGRSQWNIRFSPTEITTDGKRYHCFVEVNDGEVIRSKLIAFKCARREQADEQNPGFIRVSKTDPNYFEFDNGTFYWPLGFNIAAVGDRRASTMGVSISYDEGTFAYDRFIENMSRNGINWGRIWMSPWSFGIEWTQGYNVHYKGAGYYNLTNAWRLDHVLEAAQKRGVYLMILFTGHGEVGDYESDFGLQGGDPKQGSPYWTYNGGPINHPQEFYTNPTVKKLYMQKVRYILARWGYNTHVFSWELINEADLASFFRAQANEATAFVRDVIRYMQRIHPNRHLATSGVYYITASAGRPLLSLKEIDFNTGHIFQGSLVEGLLSRLNYMTKRYDKIFLATEAGKTPFAQDPDLTAINIRKTLWGSFMMPYAGAAAPWWWVLIDQRNLYGDFGALAAFGQGEDRRGQGLESGAFVASDASGERSLAVLSLKSRQKAYGWVYDPDAFETKYKWNLQLTGVATVSVTGLDDGPYRLEIWDSHAGKILETRAVEIHNESLLFKTPTFTSDIAFKLKKVKKEAVE